MRRAIMDMLAGSPGQFLAIGLRDLGMRKQWVVGIVFPAEVGKDYEVSFGKITYKQQTGTWTARIRIAAPKQWIDLDTGALLDPELSKFVVQAWLEL